MAKKPVPTMEDSDLPDEALRYFHGLSNWVELSENLNLKLINWREGLKNLSKISCIKTRQKEAFVVPAKLEDNTLYFPSYTRGWFAIKAIRNAFCHNGLTFDQNSAQYSIGQNGKFKIAGQFTLEAIRDFVDVYMQPKPQKKSKKTESKKTSKTKKTTKAK